jgi:CheY-like chemotaxis protein
MRVLVVEDNLNMGPFLEQGLREHGFAVDLVADGNRGFEYASTGVYDLPKACPTYSIASIRSTSRGPPEGPGWA